MDATAKKMLLRKIPYGLYICTSRHEDEVSAMLCNWVCQASFDPPMVTLAVQNDAHSREVILASETFCLNLLPKGSRETASHFAQHHEQAGNKLEGWDYDRSEGLGLPVIPEAVGYIEMKVVGTLKGGDHDILLGEVVGAEVLNDGDLFTQADAGFNYAG